MKAVEYPRIWLAPNKFIYEHRLAAFGLIGRPLQPGEEVHHIDGDKKNNAPDNLMVVDPETHRRIHHGWIKTDTGWSKVCPGCKQLLAVNESNFNRRHSHLEKGEWVCRCKECGLKSRRAWKEKRKLNQEVV